MGSVISILMNPRCPHKPNLVWYEKDVIYEIDLRMYKDSNNDGIGDLQGFQEKLHYLEKNSLKSVLFRSTIFNSTDLTTFHETILNKTSLQNLLRIFNRKGFLKINFSFFLNRII